jgi:ABC-type antimicrobial peptide transport system permease subunit
LLRRLLYGVVALDPLVLCLVAIVAALTGVAAGLVPARRAAKTDPSASLRAG